MEQQRIALHARQLLSIVSHDFDARRTARLGSQCNHLLQDGRQRDGAAREPARAGEHEQVPHDFRGAIRLAVDRLHLLAQRFREARPVTRSSSRWPSTPCSGLLSSWAMPATNWPSAASFSDCVSRLRSSSRSASSLDCGVRSRATSTVPSRCAVLIEQVRQRHHERALQHRVDDFAARRGLCLGAHVRGFVRRQPRAELRADVVGDGLLEQDRPRLPDAIGERFVDLDDAPVAIRDDHEVPDRVERVFELAPRPHDLVQQLQRSRWRSTAGGRARRRDRAGRARRRSRRGRPRRRSCPARGGIRAAAPSPSTSPRPRAT